MMEKAIICCKLNLKICALNRWSKYKEIDRASKAPASRGEKDNVWITLNSYRSWERWEGWGGVFNTGPAGMTGISKFKTTVRYHISWFFEVIDRIQTNWRLITQLLTSCCQFQENRNNLHYHSSKLNDKGRVHLE